MPSGFDTRLARLERYAPVVANDDRTSPFPMIQAFVEDNGGRQGDESWAMATARLIGVTCAELMAYLRARAEGANA